MNYLTDNDFHNCIKFVLKWEGGYVDDPKDPGGETNFGISKRSFPNLNIKDISRDQAEQIYYSHYWLPTKSDKVLGKSLQLLHFDTAVNCGVGKAMGWLNIACPKSTAFTMAIPDFFTAYYNLRKSFYEKLEVENPDNERFEAGWMNRLNAISKYKL